MDSARRRSRLRTSGVALLVLALLAGSGCTILGKRYGEPIDVENAGLEEGATSVGRIIEQLGPPTHLSALPGGMVMVYEYVDVTEHQLGISLDVVALDWFKVALGNGSANREALVLVVDDSGLLRTKEFSRWKEDVGKGVGFQFFFQVVPTVDTRHLTGGAEQLGWGRELLRSLPVTLNAAQSLDSGIHGVEMRGSPTSVGQRTLEMRTPGRKKSGSRD